MGAQAVNLTISREFHGVPASGTESRQPTMPPMRLPATRLIATRLTAATTSRKTPSAADSLHR
jgi:hypothetical protein